MSANYPGRVAISSVITKEAGFDLYRFIAKLAAESLNFEVLLNDEDSGTTQTGFNQALDKDIQIVIAIFGNVESKTVIEECNRALNNHLRLIALFKKPLSNEIMKYISYISHPLLNSDCHGFSTAAELYEHVKVSLEKYLKERITPAELSKGHTIIYKKATELLEGSRREFVLSQKTSTLFLGPRLGNSDEIVFYNKLMARLRDIDNKYTDSNMVFKHIFSMKHTLKDKNSKQYNIDIAKKNISEIILDSSRTKHNKIKIELIALNDWKSNFAPFTISDGDILTNIFFTDIEFNVVLKRENITHSSLNTITADIGRKGHVYSRLADYNRLIKEIYGY